VTIFIGLYCTLVKSFPPSHPLDPLPAPLKAIAGGLSFLFHTSLFSMKVTHETFWPKLYMETTRSIVWLARKIENETVEANV
jgi:hypothetical protein